MDNARDFAELVENWCHRDERLRGIIGDVSGVAPLGGLSNVVLDVEASNGRFVLRLPRAKAPQLVDRHAELRNIMSAARAELAVAPVYSEPDSGLLLFPFLRSSAGCPDPEELGRLLHRLHAAPDLFENKRALGSWMEDLFGRAGQVSSFHREVAKAEALYRRLLSFQVWQASPIVPSHWDVTAANCLNAENGLVLIDWEYSARGPRAWDLAYAVLEVGYDEAGEEALLAGYGQDSSGLSLFRAEVREMKVACDLVSALWALGQGACGSSAADFRSFASTRLERAERQLNLLTALKT